MLRRKRKRTESRAGGRHRTMSRQTPRAYIYMHCSSTRRRSTFEKDMVRRVLTSADGDDGVGREARDRHGRRPRAVQSSRCVGVGGRRRAPRQGDQGARVRSGASHSSACELVSHVGWDRFQELFVSKWSGFLINSNSFLSIARCRLAHWDREEHRQTQQCRSLSCRAPVPFPTSASSAGSRFRHPSSLPRSARARAL